MKSLKFSRAVLVLSLATLMTLAGIRGAAAEEMKERPFPQLVTDAWMLIIGFEADPEALKAILPPGLEANPSNLVVMNMYTVPEASQTSGFGAYTLTYLTVQLKDQDSYILGSPTGEPGRYFAFYFNSSELVRNLTSKVGIPAEEGMTEQTKAEGKLTSVLEVGGKPFIIATADVGDEFQPATGGHLNYFGLKKSEMDGKKVTQVMKYPIPFVVRTVKTENTKVEFTENIPKDHPLNRIKPKKVAWGAYMKGSFVYPKAVVFDESGTTAKSE